MVCPRCKHGTTQVIDSRDSSDGIRRRRECQSCKQRFTTYERVELVSLMVEKKDGSREKFMPEKIQRGVTIACKNRPVSEEAIARLVEQVEQHLIASGIETVRSTEIGELIQPLLQNLDEVAYVRFVSVYRSFDDVTQFTSAVDSLS